MEPWQVSHIQNNIYNLQQLTDCNSSFRAVLQQHGVLSGTDISQLEAKHNSIGAHAEVELLYSILLKRTGAFHALKDACEKTRQTGALDILNSATAPVRANVPVPSSVGRLEVIDITPPGASKTIQIFQLRYDGNDNISNEDGKLIFRRASLKMSRHLTNVENNKRVLLIFESEGILDPLESEAIRRKLETCTMSDWISQFCKLLENRADVGKALNLLLNLDNDPDLKNYRAIIRGIFEALELPN